MKYITYTKPIIVNNISSDTFYFLLIFDVPAVNFSKVGI